MGEHYLLRMKSFLAGALIATVISTGVTYAVASMSSETITACAHKKTGDLRIMTGKKCKKSERAVSWSAGVAQATQGAWGPKGDTGSPGTQGAPGSNGISQGYWSASGGGFVSRDESGFVAISDIELPAGSFIIIATSDMRSEKKRCEVEPPDGDDCTPLNTGVNSRCQFTSTAVGNPDLRFIGYSRGQEADQITLQTHMTVMEDTYVTVQCANDNSVGGVWVDTVMHAIAVDNVSRYTTFVPCAQREETDDAIGAAC